MSWFKTALFSALFSVTAITAHAEIKAPASKAWTILVFLNANNNLDPFSYLNLNEMEMVGSTDQVNVVVQITHRGANKTLRYLMKKDADSKNVTSPVVETLDKQDMGSHETLSRFIEWGMEKYPAQHYMVDIWNHGSGWEKKASASIVRGISYDDSTGNHITTPQLGDVLEKAAAKAGDKIELIGYDACLMQMCEVASETAAGAKFQVASEEVEPGQGWPYDQWLTALNKNPSANGGEAGKMLVEAFNKSYSNGSHGSGTTTLSVLDLSKMEAVERATDALASALIAAKDQRAAVVQAIQASQSFEDATHHDVFDLVDQLSRRVQNDGVKQAGAALKKAAAAAVIAEAKTGMAVARSGGLAIWAPTSGSQSQMEDYQALHWAKGQWDELLQALGSDREMLRASNSRVLFGE